MPLFRVYGLRSGEDQGSILVECASESVARNAAIREGFINTTKVELVEGEPEETPLRPARPPSAPRRPDLTKFDRQPVWTIAKGVFVGLALWTASMIALAWALRALDVLTG